MFDNVRLAGLKVRRLTRFGHRGALMERLARCSTWIFYRGYEGGRRVSEGKQVWPSVMTFFVTSRFTDLALGDLCSHGLISLYSGACVVDLVLIWDRTNTSLPRRTID